MADRHDEHGIVCHHGLVGDVVGHIQHGADHQVDLVAAQHLQPVAPRDVVQPQVDARIGLGEAAHCLGQDVEDGRFARADVQLAGFQLAVLGDEAGVQVVHALHQRLGQGKQLFAVRRQLEHRPAPLEQRGVQLPLQCLYLQGDRGLAEKQLLRRLGDAAAAHHLTERADLFEAIVLVVGLLVCGHLPPPFGLS